MSFKGVSFDTYVKQLQKEACKSKDQKCQDAVYRFLNAGKAYIVKHILTTPPDKPEIKCVAGEDFETYAICMEAKHKHWKAQRDHELRRPLEHATVRDWCTHFPRVETQLWQLAYQGPHARYVLRDEYPTKALLHAFEETMLDVYGTHTKHWYGYWHGYKGHHFTFSKKPLKWTKPWLWQSVLGFPGK